MCSVVREVDVRHRKRFLKHQLNKLNPPPTQKMFNISTHLIVTELDGVLQNVFCWTFIRDTSRCQ